MLLAYVGLKSKASNKKKTAISLCHCLISLYFLVLSDFDAVWSEPGWWPGQVMGWVWRTKDTWKAVWEREVKGGLTQLLKAGNPEGRQRRTLWFKKQNNYSKKQRWESISSWSVVGTKAGSNIIDVSRLSSKNKKILHLGPFLLHRRKHSVQGDNKMAIATC